MASIVSYIKNGTVSKGAQRKIDIALERLEGEKVEISISRHKDTRTLRQNNYYWWCLTLIGNETGYTKDEMHNIMRHRLFSYPVVFEGEEVRILKSTASAKYDEMGEYIEAIKQWAAEYLDIYVPDPHEYV